MEPTTEPRHLTAAELEAGIDRLRAAPADDGTLELVIRRPAVDERDLLDVADLHPDHGVVGDTWAVRGSRRTEDGSAHPDMQINMMNARVAALVAGTDDHEHWALAGDQLYVDLDLSDDANPPGTRLAIGTAVIEITEQPHTGCKKFAARFGTDALRFVNGEVGKELHLRGVNAKVVQAGTVRPGDRVRRVGD